MRKTIVSNYTNPSHPTAFAGVGNLRRFYKGQASAKEIDAALSSIYTYPMHRGTKKQSPRNPFYIYQLRQQLQMDLIDVQPLAEKNNGVKYLLIGIDSFSKFIWVVPMQNKEGKTSLNAIKNIISQINPNPRSILFDRGSEFRFHEVKRFFSQQKIKTIHPNSKIKAGIVERVNRSLQHLIYSYLTENQTEKYIDALPDLIKSYNSRGHRAIGFLSPEDAEKAENKNKVVNALIKYYDKIKQKVKNRKEKFKVGDTVKVKKNMGIFERGYYEQFSREYFKIIEIKRRMVVPTYIIKSLDNNETIEGGFYANEMQLITGNTFKVEKVIRQRKQRGRKQLLVKWLGFGPPHNSWINASAITADYRFR